MDEARLLAILTSSLPAEYMLISSVIENAKDATLIEVKKNLLKEYEKKETTEKAFRANGNAGWSTGGRGNGRKGNGSRKKGGGFKGKCFFLFSSATNGGT